MRKVVSQGKPHGALSAVTAGVKGGVGHRSHWDETRLALPEVGSEIIDYLKTACGVAQRHVERWMEVKSAPTRRRSGAGASPIQ